MQRTLVIGDIHGGLKALQQVMQTAAVTKDDTLIFLGDYVDGWSESAQVISFLMELQKEQTCIFIKGNHDMWCEEWLRFGGTDPTWQKYGGKETLDSYASFSGAKKLLHLNFLERMKFYEIDGQNRLFIHAGFTSKYGPVNEFNNPDFSWDRTLWEMAVAMDQGEKNALLFPTRLGLFHEIFIGHTPTLYYDRENPMQACNIWNIDTGAAFTGKLSMMDIDTKQFWQSDPVWQLYPGELGRNK